MRDLLIFVGALFSLFMLMRISTQLAEMLKLMKLADVAFDVEQRAEVQVIEKFTASMKAAGE